MELTGDLILLAQEVAVKPALITMFISTFLIWLAIGFSTTNNHKKFAIMFAACFVLSGIILLLLLYNPGLIQWIRSFFG